MFTYTDSILHFEKKKKRKRKYILATWFLGLQMEERPPAMEVSCEYIE
jgi:hypothetical protein